MVGKKDFEGKGWIYQGIGSAVILFLIIVVLIPLFSGNPVKGNLFVQLGICLIGGLLYGIICKYIFRYLYS